MSELNRMNIQDIFDNIGVSLDERDYAIVLKNVEALDKIEELFSKGNSKESPEIQKLRYMFNSKIIMQVFGEFEDFVDKEALIVLTLYNYQRVLETRSGFSEEQEKQLRQYISNAIRLIGKKDINVIDLEVDLQSDSINRVMVINSQELLRCIKKRLSLESLDRMSKSDEEKAAKIDREIDFDNITQVLSLGDIQNIISYDKEIGTKIISQISYNGIRRFARVHQGIDQETLEGQKTLQEDKEKEVKDSKEFKMAFAQAVKVNLKYLDMNKLLLVSAFRYIDMLENDDTNEVRIRTQNEKETTRESSLNIAHELIKLMRENISRGTIINGVRDIAGNERRYSLDDLDIDLKRFVKDDYIRNVTIKKAKEELLLGKKTLNEIDIEVFKRIIFTDEEITMLIKLSEDNLIFLIEHSIVEQKEIYASLHLRNECSLRLFKLIIDKNMLDGNQILKLYEYGIITLEYIKSIEDKQLLDSINIDSRVKEICISMQNSKESENIQNIEHLSKIAVLYKLLKLEGKSEQEIKEISNRLVCSFEENLNIEILEKLYQFGIISLDIAADWGIDLTEMMSKGEIKPTDLRRLYDKEIIKIDEIKNVLLYSDFSYEEKLDLIYSTFDGESEEEYITRENLIQLLENGNSYKAESKKTGLKKISGVGEKSKEYVTDPHARWKLISLLDKEYSRNFLPKEKEIIDGHRVFLLPNLNSIVIERMHEKKTGRKVTAYGSATYIMEIEEFFKHIDSIIIDGAINRTSLRELSEAEVATKIIHSKAWGENIKKYFDINEENQRYSEEERKEIDLAIDNVNRSRKER